MGFSLKLNALKSLKHPIDLYLENIPENLCYGRYHKVPLLHPGGIYNKALDKFTTYMYEHLHLISKLPVSSNDQDLINTINKSTEDLILNLCGFEDAAYSILVALSPPSDINPKTAYEWLKFNNFNKSADYFKCSVNQLMKPWNEINNRIKHNEQKLIQISAVSDQHKIYGFYLEGATKSGGLGPDKEIHDNHFKGAAALSYERTTIMIFYLFYYLSDKLAKSIKKHLKELHNFKLTKAKNTKKSSSKLSEIFSIIEKFNLTFFPKEYALKFPKLKRTGETYTITYPHGDQLIRPQKFKIEIKFKGDGYTRLFEFPNNI